MRGNVLSVRLAEMRNVEKERVCVVSWSSAETASYSGSVRAARLNFTAPNTVAVRALTASQSASGASRIRTSMRVAHTRSTPSPAVARSRLSTRRRTNIGWFLPFSPISWNRTSTSRGCCTWHFSLEG